MWKTFWQLYKKWILICATVTVVSLGLFFLYFFISYDSIRRQDIDESLARLEQAASNKKAFPRDVNFELAEQTIQRVREMLKSGELEYEDFSKMRLFNQIPRHRRPLGREYDMIFEEMNLVMDLKEEGKLDQWDELVEPKKLGRTIFDEI